MGNTADPFFYDVISRWRLCRFCLHLHNLVGRLTCNAFPEGIHPEIVSGRFIHNRPFPGQENDLTFHPCGAGPKESEGQAGRRRRAVLDTWEVTASLPKKLISRRGRSISYSPEAG